MDQVFLGFSFNQFPICIRKIECDHGRFTQRLVFLCNFFVFRRLDLFELSFGTDHAIIIFRTIFQMKRTAYGS